MTARRLKVLGALMAPLPVLAVLGSPAAQAAPVPNVAVHGDVIPAVQQAVRHGAVAPSQRISVTVSLAARNEAGLDAFLKQVADPKSKLYKHYLTVAQFAARYGASDASVAQVTGYLKSQGLTVAPVTGGHLSVTASGTARQIGKAFGVNLVNFTDKKTKQAFYANDADPKVPAALAANVVDVAGLNNHAQHTHFAQRKVTPNAVSHAISGLTPTQARKAYDLTSLVSGGYDGTGQTISLVEFSTFTQSDVTAYDSHFGLSPSTPTVVKVSGGTTDSSGKDEVELDIEVIQALAPGAKIKVYEAPNTVAGDEAMYSALASSAAPIVSISWGENEAAMTSANRSADNTTYKEDAAQGQSVYAASGDSGSDDAGNGGTSVDFPAADPYVTGVGGTTLSLTSSNAWSDETAWSGSGGGVSSYYATPSYQSSVNSGSKRTVPDVAAVADPSTGWAIYEAGSWQEFGGTSAAAPNWAAFTAIYDDYAAASSESSLGYANSAIYTDATGSNYSNDFHDVTSGSNGAYSADTGYDEVTGWGSYDGANFITDNLG
ncbi:kumamolisin [Streptomyces sp. 846.5]|nr:S53 family serine peptidase [Streptomyces sp. 846.5]TDT97624.1 kumamolisin [Streptomyces sp. 846.5]